MITSIQGLLVEATPLRAVIELNGLGYEVLIPVTTAERLPPTGSVVKLQTLAIYREDSQTLYGFSTADERDFFRLVIDQVSGVGPKSALSIMSKLSLSSLRGAIIQGDIGLLSKCPGIGKKTAERLVIELRGKLSDGGVGSVTADSPVSATKPEKNSPLQDAVLALTALGYKTADADEAIRRASLTLGPKATTEALIKKALNAS